ncbi:U3 small nucleolar RNA-associated protein 14 homolog A-like [Sorex fumeus]|uniref:U3 small nucleolar RNA-associated protein 14 homolog A-like n=1 Tax=Sorex fumeus TaxID=62283 RepID=UPI0024ACDA8F|nr:U3 small nucleolar RNA-associated protein 14 homolog A-like [Sorex fumeus]
MSLNRTAKSFLALSQQQELDDLPKDDTLSTNEDERDSDEERKHQKLLEAIRTLDGKTRPNLVQRSEASLEVSEFSISSNGSGEKLVISDLLDPIKMSSSLATVKKQLKRVNSKKIVELPLNKEELEQIHREVAFNKTSQALSRWDPIVLKNRQAEQLVFPMNKESSAFAPIEHVLSGWKAETPLEQEIFSLLCKKKQPVTDPLLTPKEKASLKAMNLEEVKLYRAELQKARALQSYYEARARREKKIKSKKHHKMLKIGKGRKTLNEIEMLQKVSPAAALEELEKIKTARMMERMNLKHQSSGKWAKSKKIMAKFDLEVRQAMQVQLAKNKELAQKFQVASENEEVEEGSVEEAGEHLFPDTVNEIQMNGVGQNPWILGRPMGDAYENEIQKDPKQLSEPLVQEASEREKEERSVAEEEISLQGFEENQLFWQKSRPSQDSEPMVIQKAKYSSCQEVLCELRAESQKLSMENDSRKQKVSLGKAVVLVQSDSLIKKEKEPLLLQSMERAPTQEELDELGKEERCQNKELPSLESKGQQLMRKPRNHPDAPMKKTKEQMIDLQNLLTTKSPSLNSLAVPTIEELEDKKERAQKQVIKEAFAGDDVIRDFLEEKREAVETSKPKDLDLILPGWGEWDGAGLKPSAKKRRRFHIKVHEGPPRKDKNLANVIITEKRNIHMAAHQVQMLPYPFTHYQQFERTIQTPVGSTWNTQRAFQKLTTPKVITKPGHVIKPMKAEDVGYRSSSRLDLSVIQRKPVGRSLCHKKQLKKKSIH